jgi:hypothetical protein
MIFALFSDHYTPICSLSRTSQHILLPFFS